MFFARLCAVVRGGPGNATPPYHIPMRWSMSEYLFKGLYLGLLFFVAVQEPSVRTTLIASACALGCLAIALCIAAIQKYQSGYRAQGRLAAFGLFLLLESPVLIYAGIILGMTAAAFAIGGGDSTMLSWSAAGGFAVGIAFAFLRGVRKRWLRLASSLALASGMVAIVVFSVSQFGLLDDEGRRTAFAIRLLLGIPLFYLLTLAGETEETEIEIGGICATLGLSLWMLTPSNFVYQTTGLLLAAALYIVYTMRILPSLRVFKHVIRGISHAKIGRYVPAFMEFRRALALDANNSLARNNLWRLHRSLSLDQLTNDPRMRDLIDCDMCLDRVASLLLEAGPSAEQVTEAIQLLELIVTQRPLMAPVVHYWRAVAETHARQFDKAAAELRNVLDGSRYAPDDSNRASVILKAWQLALTLHPELNRRAGTPELAAPGRRMEAIAAVERHLAANQGDQSVWDLKRILYSTITEADYRASANSDSATLEFDHDYTRQLGLALIHDAARWQRGAEYLRIAAWGIPTAAPTILLQIAEAQQRANQKEEVWHTYEAIAAAGRSVGPKNFGEPDRQAYFTAVKTLAEEYRSRGDMVAAIANYHLYKESVGSGVETLRTLADLYEQKGDVFGALRMTEQALLYNSKDRDLRERKDRYYYSISPDELRSRLDGVKAYFDLDYCLQKFRSLIDLKNADLDVIDWAQHLAELALVVNPESISAKVTRARALRRRGEIEPYQQLLEEVYSNKPESFASFGDEDAWYLACRLLGETYLNEVGRPDLAVPCFQAYRKSSKSGADTMYKLGQAYEQLGDRVRATKCYEHVTAYDKHPLAPDARDALYRLKTPG